MRCGTNTTPAFLWPPKLFSLNQNARRRVERYLLRQARDRAKPGRVEGSAMRVRWNYCLGGIGLAAASFVVGLEVENAIARTETTVSTATSIDRSFKGDRLQTPTTNRVRPSTSPTSTSPSGESKPLDGCESSASTIRIKPIIERCFASAPTSSELG
jgi:hypothetical protein